MSDDDDIDAGDDDGMCYSVCLLYIGAKRLGVECWKV